MTLSAKSDLLAALPVALILHGPAPAELVYRQLPDQELRLYFFAPAGNHAAAKPAALWIHGGGWTGGTCESFFPMARYTAARGAASYVVQYRLVKPAGPTVEDAIADCRAAVRYVRSHAGELGVDPQRIAVLGESAGGQLAACVGLLPDDGGTVSARPDALVLYNPLTDFAGTSFHRLFAGAEADRRAERCSPLRMVRSGLPPTLCVHGLADTVIPAEQTRRFAGAMKAAGNRCDLVLWPDLPHAFLIPDYKCSQAVVVDALRLQDTFLASLGYFSGEPTLVVSDPAPWKPKWPPGKDAAAAK